MTHVLLTGAGFTRNWGGWLASETFEYLLGCREIDDQTRRDLWTAKRQRKGFEDVLADYQQRAARGGDAAARLVRLENAIVGMFNMMNSALSRNPQYINPSVSLLGDLLHRFDAIFTLNQDLFMEYHYLDVNAHVASPRRWLGHYSPGVRALDPVPEFSIPLRASPHVVDLSITAGPQYQPYYKMHGSSNWRDERGQRLMVMGGGKAGLIGNTPLLKGYFEQFEALLRRRGTLLMIIGYSFNDLHVTDIIIKAVQEADLRLFIIDQLGLDVLDVEPPWQQIKEHRLVEALSGNIIGASRRTLATTFGGEDEAEFAKVMRFFAT